MGKHRSDLTLWFKKNPFLTAVILLECFVILALGFQLFKAQVVLEIPPASFLISHPENAQIADDGSALTIHDPAQSGKETGYISEFFPISAGAYVLTVQYNSVLDAAAPSHGFEDFTGVLSARSFANPSAITGDHIILTDGQQKATTRIYVPLTGRIKDFQLVVTYGGKGSLQIESVTVREQLIWRWVRLAAMLILFLLADLLLAMFFANKSEHLEKWARCHRYEGCLVLIAAFASLPMFANFLFNGHDLTFHLSRIGALAAELEKGQIPVRMLTTMLNGYGYPTPLFYCDILLYLPALLYNAMVPLMTCYQLYGFLVNAATCLAAFLCFSRITGNKTIGVTFAAVYTLSPQRLMTVYVRAAVGEYSAMIFLPLIVWGLWNVYHKEDHRPIAFREYLPLALGVAGIIQSHVLTLEMVALFLLGICLVLLKKTIQRHRLWALIKAAALALGMGLWFLGSLQESMVGMSVWGNQLHVISKMQNLGVYPVQLFGLFQPASGGNVAAGMQGEMPLTLGLPLILCLLLVAYVLLHRNQWSLDGQSGLKWMQRSTAVGLIAVTLTLYRFPWDGVENWIGQTMSHYLGIVQFPWRYLSIAIVALTAAGASAFQLLRDNNRIFYRRMVAIIMGALLISTGYFLSTYTSASGNQVVYDYQSLPQRIYGTISSGEYLLTDVDVTGIQFADVEKDTDSLTITDYNADKQGVLMSCKNGESAATAVLPIFFYDHYEAYDQKTGVNLPLTEGSNRRIAVTVPAFYQGTIRVCYAPPIRWRFYESISVGSWLLTAFLLWKSRKKRLAIGS